MGRSIASGGDPKGCRGRVESPLLASWATTLPKKFPPAGPDAPTPAREQGLQPYGALYCFEWRSEGAGGNEGKRVSSGYNRRRRLATRSSGKQQAERTAVRTAPIVCPEESPLLAPQSETSAEEIPLGGA